MIERWRDEHALHVHGEAPAFQTLALRSTVRRRSSRVAREADLSSSRSVLKRTAAGFPAAVIHCGDGSGTAAHA
jgi:hypothetical protein